jgi:hypothetical protein
MAGFGRDAVVSGCIRSTSSTRFRYCAHYNDFEVH